VESAKFNSFNSTTNVLLDKNRKSTQGFTKSNPKMVFKKLPKGLRASAVSPKVCSFRDSIPSKEPLNKKEHRLEGTMSALGVLLNPFSLLASNSIIKTTKRKKNSVQSKELKPKIVKKKQEKRLSKVISGLKSNLNVNSPKGGKKARDNSKKKTNNTKSISNLSPNVTKDNKVTSVLLHTKTKDLLDIESKPVFSPSRCIILLFECSFVV